LNPGWGEVFRTCPNWTWGPPSLLYNGYWVFFLGLGRGVYLPYPSGAEIKERVELYLHSYSVFSWPVLGPALPLPLPVTLRGSLVEFSLISCIIRFATAHHGAAGACQKLGSRFSCIVDSACQCGPLLLLTFYTFKLCIHFFLLVFTAAVCQKLSLRAILRKLFVSEEK
jgi:hypothetical protein